MLSSHRGKGQTAVQTLVLLHRAPPAVVVIRRPRQAPPYRSDEFVYVLAGEITLVTDEGESLLVAGMCVGFKAGEPNGHHFINRGSAEAQLIIMGARVPGDTAFYPDDDLVWLPTEEGRVPVHKDGSPYS